MADFTKLNADNAALAATLADMSAKLDAFLAKPATDDQPAVDTAAAAAEQNNAAAMAIAAKIPAV